MKRTLLSTVFGAALLTIWVGAQAAGTFDPDVATSIDRGLAWQKAHGAYTGSAGDATGLSTLALLEKRAGGIPTGPPQGYNGATATEQADMRAAVSYMIGLVKAGADPSFRTSYRNGNFLMAMTVYKRTGGPDIGGAPAPPTVLQTIDAMVDMLLSYQLANGYWPYYSGDTSNDSSTTQFAAAGLGAAKALYSAIGDPGGRLSAINAALAKARQAYVANAAQGSDNPECSIITDTECGHGYHPAFEGHFPSLQQTASGTWVQLLGGANVNTSTVQGYIEWLRDHYRYTNLDSMGNNFEGYAYWYYLWSSFKAMEFMRLSGVIPAPGNLGPNSLGTLGPLTDPDPNDAPLGTCPVRELNLDPAALPQVASFGTGAVGFYVPYPKGQYFDYAYKILGYQCWSGSGSGNDGFYNCNDAPGRYDNFASQAYALLVLARATGGACVDSDGDGVCDDVDNCPADPNPGQEPVCIPRCDVDSDSDIDQLDLSAISKARGKPASGPTDPRDANGDGWVTPADVKVCIPLCTRPNCARQDLNCATPLP